MLNNCEILVLELLTKCAAHIKHMQAIAEFLKCDFKGK